MRGGVVTRFPLLLPLFLLSLDFNPFEYVLILLIYYKPQGIVLKVDGSKN